MGGRVYHNRDKLNCFTWSGLDLAELATLYLVTEAAGQSSARLDAKQRDLQRFLAFYQGLYRHDRPEEWFVSVTKAFLKALQRERLAQPRWCASIPPRGT